MEKPFVEYLGDTLKIPKPLPSHYPRGETATRELNTNPMSFRASDIQKKQMERAAELLNMSVSEFIRWCAHSASITVLHKKEQYDKQK